MNELNFVGDYGEKNSVYLFCNGEIDHEGKQGAYQSFIPTEIRKAYNSNIRKWNIKKAIDVLVNIGYSHVKEIKDYE